VNGLPDMAYMRNQIAIAEVAGGLGLKLAGKNSAHCWRVGQHKNGDRTPSISFSRNRAKCFVCDARSLTTIDLVSAHEECSLLEAVNWICARFDVPNIPKGKKLVKAERWYIGRVGASRFPLEEMVRSGLWAEFDDATRAVLPALCCFLNASDGHDQISYRGIARYSGKRSDHTISAVIAKLEQYGLLKVTRARNSSFRECGRYTLDWNGERFQSVLSSCHEAMKAEKESERTLRAGRRLLKSNTLCTTVQREQTAHCTTLQRANELNQPQENTHCTTVQRAVSQELNSQELKSSRVWESPTFEEILCFKPAVSILRDAATDFNFGWNIEARA
jgi:hypothetical protein